MQTYHAPMAMLRGGWRKNVRIAVQEDGVVAALETAEPQPGDVRLRGPVLPGMPNLHSHAFQRAMAGLAEVAINPEDSFWTWRDLMYRLVGNLSPEHVQAIATSLYIEMLKVGYTSVAEFHYLHHDASGTKYSNPAEMSERILAAAKASGIGVTLLPAFYAHGGFGGQPPSEKQRRFINDVDGYLRLADRIAKACDEEGQRWGLCFHSLRAATKDEMTQILGSGLVADRPIHLHIAEQTKEVDDCVSWSSSRPIEWLYRYFDVDGRWCLVHATHANDLEVRQIANSRAVVGLCPTTEANLGDGIFPATGFIENDGQFGIGSDSHVSVSLVEEIRWLEYGQRLRDQKRNRLATPSRQDVAQHLYESCLAGGSAALGRNAGAIEVGMLADLLVLDEANPMLSQASQDQILGRWLFGGADSWVTDVAVAGKWVVQNRRHEAQEKADAALAQALGTLMAS